MKELFRKKRVVLFITTMQEAFSAIVPFFLLSSFLSLFYFLSVYFSLDLPGFGTTQLERLIRNLNAFSSVAATVAVAYFFAIRLQVSQIISVLLSTATFITILFIEHPAAQVELPYGFTPATLINPIVSTFLLKVFYPKLSLNIPLDDANRHIYRLFNYLFVFFFAYLAVIVLYVSADRVLDSLLDRFNDLQFRLPDILRLAIRDFFVQLFWFFGVHGDHTVNALAGKDILFRPMLENLTYAEFNRLFVVIGGAGIGLGLLLSLLFHAREGTIRLLAKISSPFVIFNINTLLTYAVIVLNRFFFLPFVLLPLANLTIAYVFLQLVPVRFTEFYVTWTTPVFVDAYLKTDGNPGVTLLQLFLVAFDTAVYFRFTGKFLASQSMQSHTETLERNLEIPSEIRARQNVEAFSAHREIIEAGARLDEVVRSLTADTLHVHYQPKIDLETKGCSSCEALIRYRHEDGRLSGPFFLGIIEKAGLAPVIDLWVCRRVLRDLDRWKEAGFTPRVNINLDPQTLRSADTVGKIIQLLHGKDIVFEIIERSFLHGEPVTANLKRLRRNGFGIAIDDFGVGYSNLETIISRRIDELKIDKSLIDIIETPKGSLVCGHIVRLCHDIGCRVVAEGVETREQYEIVRALGADHVQGFLFSPALPASSLPDFMTSFALDRSAAGPSGETTVEPQL